jgi:3-isopropylmalate/(R)-2-methylmalate dehydratase large subunit
MAGRTMSEQILSAKSGRRVSAGDVVVCDVDLVVGTDASGPMAIDYFDRMGGTTLFDLHRVVFSLDHYAPPTTVTTRAFHDRVRSFARQHGAECFDVGDGISHQVLVDRKQVAPGQLIVGADSHTVMCGAMNLFAIGVGSSDLAAAMLTGQVWLRVPETIRVKLSGRPPDGVGAKDVALAVLAEVGADGADYQAIEWAGDGWAAFPIDDRLVLSNLAVEMGAKAAIGPFDAVIDAWCDGPAHEGIHADADARYVRDLEIDLARLTPQVSAPHEPGNVVALAEVARVPVQMVFIGTCTGGRASDFRDVLRILESAGGRLALDVALVLTPASGDVERALKADGSYQRLAAMGGQWTTPGCGACCGTSGVIPAPGTTVVSTANRNFKARMGEPTASIYLASPIVCATAAVTGTLGGHRADSVDSSETTSR